MTSAEIKLDIYKALDKLKKNQLNEISGVINNYVHSKLIFEEWDSMPIEQKTALLAAKKSIRKNGGKEHQEFMSQIRNKISRGEKNSMV